MIDKIFFETIIRIIIIIVLLFTAYFSFKTILNKILIHQTKKTKIDVRKFDTLKVLFTNLVKYVLIVIGVLVILDAFGFKVSNIVAGLGIFSAVLVLSLQDSLKDFFAGIFILLENQFSIGDIVKIGDFKGEVIFLGFKSTRIKSYTGEIKIISNRNISEVINYSKSNNLTLIDINVAYEEDIDNIFDILNKLCNKLNKEIDYITGEIKLLGIENLSDNSIIFRICAESEYANIFSLQRQILKEVKKEFDNNNIKIPYPQMEVHHGK